MKNCTLIGIIVWTGCIYALGIYLFTKGFLLNRFVIERASECDTDLKHVQNDDHGHAGCWMHARYKRAVVLIIDALRYDFIKHNATIRNDAASPPYANKLKHVTHLLKKFPRNSRLYKFVADPPTTTMQRLKGMTTGSLPTFVDAGSNFASTEITEDNFVDQLAKNGKKITFMGDDTWMGLFPNRFRKAYHFPSFNVKDLHTIDDGILRHLMPEMKMNDWDVLVAHFLGVDHCGHRYGPNHPAMAEKLSQMNQVIRNVTKQMDADTILFVMGDHGMTRSGDHGGDSVDEVDAGLFIYSPSKIAEMPGKLDDENTVSQLDFVPTFSLLMGIPIPFSNLGSVIPELFTHCPWWQTESNPLRRVYHSIKATHINAHQVKNYLDAYMQAASDFPARKYAELSKLFTKTESDLQNTLTKLVSVGDNAELRAVLERIRGNHKRFLSETKTTCQGIWAKFDLSAIVLGIFVICIAIAYGAVMSRLTLEEIGDRGLLYWACTVACLAYTLIFYTLRENRVLAIAFAAIGACVGIFALVIYKVISQGGRVPPTKKSKSSIKDTMKSWSSSLLENYNSVIASVCFIGYCVTMSSNSFVVNEDVALQYLLQTLIWCLFWANLHSLKVENKAGREMSQRKPIKSFRFEIGRVITSVEFRLLTVAIAFSILLRLSLVFRACREEQWTCEPTNFLQALSSIPPDASIRNWRYFLSVACLASAPFFFVKWLKHHGNLNGTSPAVLCVKYVMPIMAVCICFYWAQQALPQKLIDQLPAWNQVLLPRLVFFLFVSSVVICAVKPLTIFTLGNQEKTLPMFPSSSVGSIIPQVYNHMKSNWQTYLSSSGGDTEKPPLVYGLATVYSGGCLVILLAVTLLLALLLKDGLVPGIIIAVFCMFLLLELHAAKSVTTKPNDGCIPTYTIVMWIFLSTFYFFATGHQAVIPTLQWDAAFVGFHGDHSNTVLPGLLILMNTFASQVLFTVGLPLVIFWPYFRGHWVQGETGEKSGEFALCENPDIFKLSILRLFLVYLSLHGIQLLCTMGAAGLHRRHLMVWKIFAPRFIFEAVSFLVVFFICCFILLFVMRLDKAVSNWATALWKKQNKDFSC
ncbi:GPI ethanolamine phosphate transferase 3, catalytic subunit-like [Tubulanus polymorphus]|uniref:GPI ethanolamine phosphate transferase 3, catalytic subunit-like n=1 Tax=Tubulanus polymorphus TaxID=672921 RepID=UPI003DA36405